MDKFCRTCGGELTQGAGFCSSCGNAVGENAAVVKLQINRDTIGIVLIILGTIGVVSAGIIMFLEYLRWQERFGDWIPYRPSDRLVAAMVISGVTEFVGNMLYEKTRYRVLLFLIGVAIFGMFALVVWGVFSVGA
ncbi:MAG: hypothetical protein FWE06_03565 [Oscillospiraceae bacterium]|nr:hypothetical protein [Oscillospiraceae bacterium]